MQRWTVPSCQDCNQKHGELEKDLLVRMALCVDPMSEGAAGLAVKALRSMGLAVEALSNDEKTHRDALLAKFRSELVPYSSVAGNPGAIPGLSPPASTPHKWSIPIPWAGLSIITEKIARGCEHKLSGRFLRSPYGIRTSVADSGTIPEPYVSFASLYDFGPGFRVARVFAVEDPSVVLYWFSVWGALHLCATIDLEEELKRRDSTRMRVDGLQPEDVPRAMRISPYLRDQHR